MIDRLRLFVDDTVLTSEKSGKRVNGDWYRCCRNENYTDFILCDGIGSGIKAAVAAKMCTSRIVTLLESGMSLKKIGEKLAHTMHGIRSRDIPYAVFVVVRILNDGNFFIIGYETPTPVILHGNCADKCILHHYTTGGEILYESSGKLNDGDSIVLCSDGITQAGLGAGYAMGWGTEGLVKWFDRHLGAGAEDKDIVQSAFEHAVTISGGYVDDMTLALLQCRKASEVSLLSGPPRDKGKDDRFVGEFLDSAGIKIICGSSTLDMVSRHVGRTVTMQRGDSPVAPPKYILEGIDMAAEGAVTLNQLFNILEEDPAGFDEESVVTDICRMLQDADIIRVFLGDAVNEGHDSIIFRQTGILPRLTIMPLIIEKLRKIGKVVILLTP